MKLVKSVKESLTHIFDKEYEFLMNNPSYVKEIDLEQYVFQKEITDFDLISVFTELQYLNISGTEIRDISPIRELENLEVFYADFCKITDLTALNHIGNLKELDLSAPMDYINTLEPLRRSTKLEKLYVPDHPIKTIEPINKLNRLKILSIGRTEVPLKEIEEFKKLHPSCEVLT